MRGPQGIRKSVLTGTDCSDCKGVRNMNDVEGRIFANV